MMGDNFKSFNKLVLHPSFKSTINEIRKVNVTITQSTKFDKFDFEKATFPPNGKIKLIEEMGSIDLKAKHGEELSKKYIFSGYDESKQKYLSLEGSAYFTAHSLVITRPACSKDSHRTVPGYGTGQEN